MKSSLVVLVVLSLLGVLGCAQPNSVPGPAAESGGAKAALKRINELDGEVTCNARKDVVGVNLLGRATSNADLALLKALPALAELEVWGPGIDDKGMTSLGELIGLKVLVVENTGITDAGLAPLSNLKKLTSLNLRRSSNLTDEGMAQIAKLPNLQQLHLLFTPVGDAGLAHLTKLTKLKLLDLRGCKQVSDAGMDSVKELVNLKSLKFRRKAPSRTKAWRSLRALPSSRSCHWKTPPFPTPDWTPSSSFPTSKTWTSRGSKSATTGCPSWPA